MIHPYDLPPTHLYGIPLHRTSLAVQTTYIDRRVLGGYMNHWLIREKREETVPAAFMVTLPGQPKQLFIHPALYEKLWKKLREECAL